MSYLRQQTARDCEPTKDPADQPKVPADGKACEPLAETTAPTLDPPEPCPEPPAGCTCPTKTGAIPECLDILINKQTAAITIAAKAEAFKKDLLVLQKAANDAKTKYTRDKYGELVTEWLRQDAVIAELIRKLVCAVPCWHCILDCYVCPLLHDLHYAEKWLYNDENLYQEVHNLYDLQYWHQRDKSAKQHRFDRIDGVLKAWANPADTIGKALATNKGLTDSASKYIGTEPGKAIYDVFLILVPMHLAIAPPASAGKTTTIDKKYTKFCECDEGKPDACCSPDVGEWSLRQRLVGPQPYLIDPNEYLMLICCLIEKRYGPAKEALNQAEVDLIAVGERIAIQEAKFKNGWVKSFETAAKAAIPSVIDCCEYEQDEETTPQQPYGREQRC